MESQTSQEVKLVRFAAPVVEALGRNVLTAIRHAGGMGILSAQVAYWTFRRPWELRLLMEQLEFIGVRSMSVVNITALFTGMVLAVQSAYTLSRFGAKIYIGTIVGLSLVRELGPVLTALMVGGRVGSGMTAEIGSMVVTEQVDAQERAHHQGPLHKGIGEELGHEGAPSVECTWAVGNGYARPRAPLLMTWDGGP